MGAHWRYLTNTIEPSVCSGDAALCYITLISCSLLRRHNVGIGGLLLPTEYRGLSVSLSASQFGSVCHTGERYKTAVPIDMPFGLRTRVSPGKDVLNGIQIPMGSGNFEGAAVVKYRDTLRSTTKYG